MTTSKYTVDYFIDKFSKIPKNLWIVFHTNPKDDGACCVLGHVGARVDGNKYDFTEESIALINLFGSGDRGNVTSINDGPCHPNYKQKTPKERILAALQDIKNGTYKPCYS